MWIGTVQASDEHSIGTHLGVFTSHARASFQERQRFSATAIEAMRGMPWKSSARHEVARRRLVHMKTMRANTYTTTMLQVESLTR